MKKLLPLLLLLASFHSYCQPTFYERTYGLGRGMSIEKALNGNFIIGAQVGAFPSGQAYYFLINPNGDTIRSMFYGAASLNSVSQTSDSGFIFIGDTCCDRRAGVYKTDSVGNIQWETRYDEGEWGTYGACIIPNYEGGYFVSYVHDGDGPDNYYHVLKIDASGQTLADTSVNESIHRFYQNQKSVQLTSDSGLITASTQFFSEGMYLTKLNSNDSFVWQKYFRDTTYVWGYQSYSLIQTHDGGYLIAGYMDSIANNGSEPYLGLILKTDNNGDSLWSKRYYFPTTFFELISVVENSNGEFYFAGEYGTRNPFYNGVVIMKTDNNGDSLWTRFFTGYGSATPNAIILDSAENPMVLGWTEDTTLNQFYIYLIKTDTSGNIPLRNIQLTMNESEINIFPNPVRSTLTIACQKENVKEFSYVLRNILGQAIYEKREKNLHSSFKKTIDLSSLYSGVYLLEITLDGSRTFKKVVKD